ncbi:hypothetical protein [Nevskia sp.]|uniref:hypothetical protein n=1 Tax=Nevskia sp. TaxID=1929292 RepID=UPI0025FCF8B6|nr:hypothetical protein [Nevskia sp.]
MLTTSQLECLTSNVDRLLLASLQQLGSEILGTAQEPEPPMSAEDREALALARLGDMNLDTMDLSALDGIDYDMFGGPASPMDFEPGAPVPAADPEALAAALAALPAGLPPLTEPLSEAALAQWLAVEQAGSAPLNALIAEVRRLALSQAL